MGLTLLQAPAVEPVSLDEAKLHLRVDDATDDDLIVALITQARERAERVTGRALVTQLWRQTWDTWPATGILRPRRPPLVSVQAVSYLDADGARQTVDGADYLVTTDTAPGCIQPVWGLAWPACRAEPGSVRVDYTAGYGAAAAVPASIKGWIKLAIGAWYAQREAIITGTIVTDLPAEFFASLLADFAVEHI